MENTIKTISFRQAVKIEHPEGIPLSRNFQDYGVAWNGNLLLSYEPPVVIKNTISIGVVGRIQKTTVSFSGTLETEFAGDTFAPTQDLIGAVQKVAKEMAADIGEHKDSTIGKVIEELLNFCVVNVPVKQIYEKIRVDYPTEYRSMNLEYKRRHGVSIEESMPELFSQQQEFRFGSSKGFIRTALKEKDIVVLDTDKLKQLKKVNQKLYEKIAIELEKVKPVNGKYIVFQEAKDDTVFLMGKNPQSKTGYSRTDLAIPSALFDIFEEPKEDELDWMTPGEKKQFGVEDPEVVRQQRQENKSKQQEIMNKLQLPKDVFTNIETAIGYHGVLLEYVKELNQSGLAVPDRVKKLLQEISKHKDQMLQHDLQEKNVPMEVLTNPQTASQYARQIQEMAQAYAKNKYVPAPQFQNLVKSLKQNPA